MNITKEININSNMTTTREHMKYSQGKIYKIEPIGDHDEGDIYIGSSCCKYLSQRMREHRDGYKRWKKGKRNLVTSFNIFEKYGLENCEILLLESVCCENINDLRAREAFHIRNLKCVNKQIPLQTRKEWNEENKEEISYYYKQLYKTNKDEILERNKTYSDANKDKEKLRKKQYYEANREKINERNNQYREKNKENIIEKARLKRQAKRNAQINLVV